MVAGSVCLTFSLSLYQTGLSVTAGLALLLLLHRFLVEERDESLLLLRLLVMGLCGTLVYFLLYKLLLFAGNLQAAGYGGADQFGLVNILKNLSKTLGQAYLDFYSYYIGHDIAANSYGVVGVTATLFIVGGAGIARQLWKRRDKIVVLQAILCIVLLPVAVNVTSVLLPGNTLLLRTAGGFLPIFPFLLAEAQAAWPDGTLHRICGGVALLLAVLIVRCYSVQVSADGMTMLAYKQQYISVMRQIEADVTASPEYQDAECLAVAGRLPSEKYPLNPVLQDKADPFAVSTVFWGMAFSDRVAWINGFYEELGWQPRFCDEARYTEIINSPEFGEMPCYPEQGAIQLLDGVLVVKVSS